MLNVKLTNVLFSWVQDNETREKPADFVNDVAIEKEPGEGETMSFKIETHSSLPWKGLDFHMEVKSDKYNIQVYDPVLVDELEGKININCSKKDDYSYHILLYDPNQDTDETGNEVTLLTFQVELKEYKAGPTFEISVIVS